jgi:hypothetical protein
MPDVPFSLVCCPQAGLLSALWNCGPGEQPDLSIGEDDYSDDGTAELAHMHATGEAQAAASKAPSPIKSPYVPSESPLKHSLALLELPERRKERKMTPRAESTLPLDFNKTPRSARKTPRSARKVPDGPLASARVGMDSSTFAVALANGSYFAPEVPGEDAPGVGISMVAPGLRERSLGRCIEAWDEPVRLQSEALSLALGINWTKYNEVQSGASTPASAPATAAPRRDQAIAPTKSAANPVPASLAVPTAGGTAKASHSQRGPARSDEAVDGGSKSLSAKGQTSMHNSAKAASNSGVNSKRTTPRAAGDSVPKAHAGTKSPPKSPPESARATKAYTRDGRLVDISMISDVEAHLVARVQGHSTLGNPSASHPSVGKYAFDEDGVPSIIQPEVTPRSSMTPRSVGQTPRTPRSARGNIDTSSLHKAIGKAFGNSSPPSSRGGASSMKLGSAASTPACATPLTSGRDASGSAAGERQAPGGAKSNAAKKDKDKSATTPRRDARFAKDAAFAKTHIDYYSRITPADFARSLHDLRVTTLSIQTTEASKDHGPAVSNRAARGGVPTGKRRGSVVMPPGAPNPSVAGKSRAAGGVRRASVA